MSPEQADISRVFIAISDPCILEIPIKECGEIMIDLREQEEIVIGPSPEIDNNQDYFFLRQSVYQKLCQAQQQLPDGLRFCLYEGYRSLALQKILFDTRYAYVKASKPTASATELFHETIRMVSPVVNLDGSANVPPHATGAAVDVYLIDKQNKAVDMGVHPQEWLSDVDGHLSQTDAVCISSEARYHRALMAEVLTEAGLVNYPTEYWHWSYGDRYWAFFVGESCAKYDLVKRPDVS